MEYEGLLKGSCVTWIRLAQVAITCEAHMPLIELWKPFSKVICTVKAVSDAVTRDKKAYIFQCEVIGN